MASAPGTYFVYRRYNGRLYRSKYWDMGVYGDTARYYDELTVVKFPITTDEFYNLSLDELEKKYPIPQDKREVKL